MTSLRERIRNKHAQDGPAPQATLFERFGLLINPFPPAGAPGGHPHLETEAENKIIQALTSFDRDSVSQVLVIEGTQGVGKTNLLSYFQAELQDLYREDKDFYIIRYYPDPEQSFDGIIRRIFQEFSDAGLIRRLATSLAEKSGPEQNRTIEAASSYEVRLVLRALLGAASSEDEDEIENTCSMALEWLLGMRLLKIHREVLGVQLRLDTVEAKTQALRDMVIACSTLGLLRGVFLLLDELEKQDYSVSKQLVLRYLSAIRALVDSLPKHLFMLVALTTEAKRRYFVMLPAFAGRLQNSVMLQPLKTAGQAADLAAFYIADAKAMAVRNPLASQGVGGNQELLSAQQIRSIFIELKEKSASEKGLEGVSHRDYLNALHRVAEQQIANVN